MNDDQADTNEHRKCSTSYEFMSWINVGSIVQSCWNPEKHFVFRIDQCWTMGTTSQTQSHKRSWINVGVQSQMAIDGNWWQLMAIDGNWVILGKLFTQDKNQRYQWESGDSITVQPKGWRIMRGHKTLFLCTLLGTIPFLKDGESL